MARRSTKLLRYENSLYKYNNKTQSWDVDNIRTIVDNNLFDIGTHATCKHMSQKVTPTKFRRGSLYSWPITTFFSYKHNLTTLNNIFYFEFFSKQYINNVLKNLRVFYDSIEIKKIKNIYYFTIFYYESKISVPSRELAIPSKRKGMFQKSLLIDNDDLESSVNPFWLDNKKTSERLNTKKLSTYLEEQIGTFFKKSIKIVFKPKKGVDSTAVLFANILSNEIEKSNANFKKALGDTLSKIKEKSNIKGIRVNCSGRLGRTPIAKTEWFKLGQIPLNTITAPLEYANSTAFTKYGSLGVKVWIYYHSNNK